MNHFPAKLLLFGEYTILLGSSALSLPFNYFGAALMFSNQEPEHLLSQTQQSNRQIKGLSEYLMSSRFAVEKFLDLDRLARDISQGLYLASTIPQRYGMGSSGALCAAIYSGYPSTDRASSRQLNPETLVPLRSSFVIMESFFHGKSSGFDPLVSWFNRPLMQDRYGNVSVAEFNRQILADHGVAALLVDSGRQCTTGPLVKNFLTDFVPDGKVTSSGFEMCNMVNSAIEKLISGDIHGMLHEINRLSLFQLTHLKHLIPEKLRPLWAEGLESGLFTMKLCGSGGGGFLLCFTRNEETTTEYFHNKKVPIINVSLS
ncbi:MAG: hypothetical protein Q8M08_06835 [Bacteroidales bacterium]|nr:hypothetical protein [Bacteroidales bacterium]